MEKRAHENANMIMLAEGSFFRSQALKEIEPSLPWILDIYIAGKGNHQNSQKGMCEDKCFSELLGECHYP